MSAPAPDAEIVASLEFYADAPGLVAISSLPRHKGGERFSTDPEGLEAAARYVEKLDAEDDSKGVYVRGTTVREPGRGARGSDEHTVAWRMLSADLDHGKPGYAPDALAVRRIVAEAVAAGVLPQPTRWVDSGHGLYPEVWLEDWSTDLRARDTLAARYRDELMSVFRQPGYALDSQLGQDSARVWRLPGTTNRKDPAAIVAATVVDVSGVVYSIDELSDILGTSRPAPATHSLAPSALPLTASPSPLKLAERTPYTRAQAERHVRTSCDRFINSTQGGQNNALNDMVLALARFATTDDRPGHWGPDDVVGWATDAAVGNGYAQRDPASMRGTIRSALRAGMSMPLPCDLAESAAATAERPISSWVPLDLGPYLRGEISRPELTCGLCRDDGIRFLYPGKEHSIIGEMESGKSWFALACVAAEIVAGNVVVYAHFEEEDPTDTVQRLVALGVTPASIELLFRFVGPAAPITDDDVTLLIADHPSLVVLDGVNEAMALHGQGIREEDGAAAFRAALVKPFTRAGAAVVSLDHVVKDPEKRGGYALGSIHKGNGLSGALIVLENAEPFGRGRRGRSGVYVTKDRPGELRRNGEPTRTPRKFYMGEMVVDAEHEGLEFSVYAPKPDGQVKLVGQEDTETAVLAAVEAVIAAGHIATTAKIEAAAPLRAAKVRSALESLTLGGHLIETRGARNARVFTPLAMASTGPETTSSQDQSS